MPQSCRVSGKLPRQTQTERPVGARRHHGVLQPVDVGRLPLAPAAEIDPRVRVLVHEQRRRPADVAIALERHRGGARRATTRRRSGASAIRWRAGRGSSARSSDPNATRGTPTRLPSVRQQADRRRASRRNRHACRWRRPAAHVRVRSKHCRTVSTPASSSAVSIDDSSLDHSRAPVRMLTKWKNQPRW